MASNTQITTVPVDMDQFARLLEEQMNTVKEGAVEAEVMKYFAEIGETLGGQTIGQYLSEGIDPSKLMGLIPRTLISKAGESSGASAEDIQDYCHSFFEMLSKAWEMGLAPQDAGEPNEFGGVKRVQTMKLDEDLHTMTFGPKTFEQLSELFKPLGLDGPATGDDSNADLKPLPLAELTDGILPVTNVPVANPALAKEQIAKYRKHVDDVLTHVGNAGLHGSFKMFILKSFPIRFEARLPETRKATLPILKKIDETLAEMNLLLMIQHKAWLGSSMKIFFSEEDITRVENETHDSDELKRKWDKIEADIEVLINKCSKAELEAKEKEVQGILDSLD